ncbi:MAG: hypothetical protein HKP09_06445, partial [Enterobacterales bacterium]|nr:hypothetical protein [Enterobacterales bacterium]
MNNSLKTRLFKLLGLLILLASLSLGYLWKYTDSLLESRLLIPEEGVFLEIKSGDTFNSVSNTLFQAQIGPSRFWSRLIALRFPE